MCGSRECMHEMIAPMT
ncbi:hypothetical protein F383_31314 [Gossypium arboreum]|uniref:Uncharacterized protein n=1 Tax=Gossypium arboreum TaxID=29729 RepID=A0A0B0MWI4_GOSAR|nr:hypothetical protein F383_31314 [Gossypium arboreum]